MNSNDFYIPINVEMPIEVMLDEDIKKVMALPGNHPFFNATNFTVPDTVKELLSKLKLTLQIDRTFLFHLAPHDKGRIHTDGIPGSYQQRPYGINFCWGGHPTEMFWYEKESPFVIAKKAGIDIARYDDNTINQVYSEVLTGCNLVNTLYPHMVSNYSDEYRICLSVGIKEPLSWIHYRELLRRNNLIRI